MAKDSLAPTDLMNYVCDPCCPLPTGKEAKNHVTSKALASLKIITSLPINETVGVKYHGTKSLIGLSTLNHWTKLSAFTAGYLMHK